MKKVFNYSVENFCAACRDTTYSDGAIEDLYLKTKQTSPKASYEILLNLLVFRKNLHEKFLKSILKNYTKKP